MKLLFAAGICLFSLGAVVAIGASNNSPVDVVIETRTLQQSESWMACNKDLAISTPLDKDETVTLYHYVVLAPEGDSRGGILCGWLDRTDGIDGWIGFGMSPDGHMADGIGIIGLPDDGTVEKYWLYDESPNVEQMSDDKQTLMFTSITQDGDGTRMEFAKFLNEEDEISFLGDGEFLYALGGSNELALHLSAGHFGLDLEILDVSSTTTTTTAAATTDTSSTTTAIEGETFISCVMSVLILLPIIHLTYL